MQEVQMLGRRIEREGVDRVVTTAETRRSRSESNN
jgi:hypothetical protein